LKKASTIDENIQTLEVDLEETDKPGATQFVHAAAVRRPYVMNKSSNACRRRSINRCVTITIVGDEFVPSVTLFASTLSRS
jgi:hypothetical protein